mgnify:CR=1 FL=1
MASRYWRCRCPVWIDGALDGVHMMPSRQFLVRQAVLNAAHIYWPTTVKVDGMAHALLMLSWGGGVSFRFLSVIKNEFRKLTERNWEPLA